MNITIRLAQLPPIPMVDISPEEESVIREAEYNINKLWNSWRQRFSDKPSEEVLALIAFQFARLFYSRLRQEQALEQTLTDFEQQLDRLVVMTGSDGEENRP